MVVVVAIDVLIGFIIGFAVLDVLIGGVLLDALLSRALLDCIIGLVRGIANGGIAF